MMQRPPTSGDGPTPEQLAAYADGELDTATRDWVETWLAEHPQAAAEVDATQRLARLWLSTSPAGPSETAWDCVLHRIADRVTHPAEAAGAVRRWRRGWAWGVALGAAAAVLLALGSLPLWRGSGAPDETGPRSVDKLPGSLDQIEPFPVASAGDVEIISIEDADLNSLVVGDPPVRGPLNLASANDITLESVDPAPGDGMVPWVQMDQSRPMIVAPLDALPNAEEEKP